MTLEDLRAFVAAYQAKSMSEAARQLGCTQGAVAQHVRRLEQELGAELFLRMRRGVEPTDRGRTLYEAAQGALEQLELAAQDIGRSRKQTEARLRITTSTGIVRRYLREPILELRSKFPDVQISIEAENTADERLNALREGRADLALVPLTEPLQSLDVRPYAETELVLLVHPAHRFAKRAALQPADVGSLR